MIDNHVTEIVRNDLSHFLSLIIWICNQYKENQSNHSYHLSCIEPGSQFADIRQLLNANRVSDAEELLEGIPQSRRDAEWYFLRGRVFYVRGWLDQAYNYYVRANQMSPGNAEYQTALNQLMWQRNTGRPAGGYGDYRNVQAGGASGCDMCMGLICADTCCECMGGDLISCC